MLKNIKLLNIRKTLNNEIHTFEGSCGSRPLRSSNISFIFFRRPLSMDGCTSSLISRSYDPSSLITIFFSFFSKISWFSVLFIRISPCSFDVLFTRVSPCCWFDNVSFFVISLERLELEELPERFSNKKSISSKHWFCALKVWREKNRRVEFEVREKDWRMVNL